MNAIKWTTIGLLIIQLTLISVKVQANQGASESSISTTSPASTNGPSPSNPVSSDKVIAPDDLNQQQQQIYWEQWGQALFEYLHRDQLMDSAYEGTGPEEGDFYQTYNNVCTNFVDEKTIGVVGQAVSNVLNSQSHSKDDYYNNLLEGTPDMKKLCPKFSQLAQSEKIFIYSVLLGGMAYFESTCSVAATKHNDSVDVKTRKRVRKTAKGYFQLHLGSEPSYASRSLDCPKNCANDASKSTRCTISMLKDQIDRDNSIFSNTSYWDVLRPNGKSQSKVAKIKSTIKNLPICSGSSKRSSGKAI